MVHLQLTVILFRCQKYMTALDDLAEKGEDHLFFAKLAEIVEKYNGLWSPEAEQYLLENAPAI